MNRLIGSSIDLPRVRRTNVPGTGAGAAGAASVGAGG